MNNNKGQTLPLRNQDTSRLKKYLAIIIFSALANATLLCGPAIATRLIDFHDFNAKSIGMFFFVEYAGYFTAGLLFIFISNRFSWHRISYIAISIFILTNVSSIIFIDDSNMLMATRYIAASFAALINAACIGTANYDEHPARAYSFFLFGQLMFGVIMLAVLPPVFDLTGLGAYYAILAVLSFISVPLIRHLTEKPEAKDDKKISKTRTNKNLTFIFACGSILSILFYYFAIGGLWTYVGELARWSNMSASSAGMTLSFATAAGVIGVLTAASFKPGVSIAKMLFSGYVMLLVACIMFGYSESIILYATAAILFKYAWTFLAPFIFTAVGNLDETGKTGAYVNIAAGAGLALGPLFSGVVINSYDYYWMLGLQFIVFCASFICALWLTRMYAKYYL